MESCPKLHFMQCTMTSVIKILIVVGLLAFLVGVHYRNFKLAKGMDFEHCYVGAKMVAAGQGPLLHDPDTQFDWQGRILGRVSTPFNYPAPMALLYWPTTLLDINGGYLLWTILSTLMFAASVLLLNRSFGFAHDSWFLLLLCTGYLPVHATLSTGQCDAFLLLAYVTSLLFLKKGKPEVSGLVLSLALLKFHLVLPFAFVMLIRKQWRFLLGFCGGAIVMLGVWLLISGPGIFTSYPRLLMSIKVLPRSGFEPSLMANFRGVFYVFTGHEAPIWLLAAVALVGLTLVAKRWKGIEQGFAASMTMMLLTNYHGYVYDLILLLVPLMVWSKIANHSKLALCAVIGLLVVPVIPYVLVRTRSVWPLVIPAGIMCWTLIYDPMDTSGSEQFERTDQHHSSTA